MPGATSKYALPYSAGGDPVNTVDDTMQDLAELLDLMNGETDTAQITAAGAGTVTLRVNYARSYAALGYVPRVMLQQVSTHADSTFYVTGEDATGFTLGLRTANAGTAQRTVRWFVRGMK